RLQCLDSDPVTAPHVRWIFVERLAGRSIAGIARRLNEKEVECASSADRQRNPHRTAQTWTVQTVAVILNNPCCTGREVWQRISGARSARTAGPGNVSRDEPGRGGRSRKRLRSWSWSARGTSSRSKRYVRPVRPRTGGSESICALGCWYAGCADGGWVRTGSMADRAIGAATATTVTGRADRLG